MIVSLVVKWANLSEAYRLIIRFLRVKSELLVDEAIKLVMVPIELIKAAGVMEAGVFIKEMGGQSIIQVKPRALVI